MELMDLKLSREPKVRHILWFKTNTVSRRWKIYDTTNNYSFEYRIVRGDKITKVYLDDVDNSNIARAAAHSLSAGALNGGRVYIDQEISGEVTANIEIDSIKNGDWS